MILKRVSINGYKSFRRKVDLPIGERTAVLIGPNDHGKTNALRALEKMNPEKHFTTEEANDLLASPDAAYISFTVGLTDLEIRTVVEQYLSLLKQATPPPTTEGEAELSSNIVATTWPRKLEREKELELLTAPNKSLQPRLEDVSDELRPGTANIILSMLPKVFLFWRGNIAATTRCGGSEWLRTKRSYARRIPSCRNLGKTAGALVEQFTKK